MIKETDMSYTLQPMTRRGLLQLAAGIPAAHLFANFRALAAPLAGKVRITAIKAMQIGGTTNNCLIKVETDAGLTGYGEAGASGPMARARIATMKDLLIGKDALSIERHFHEMSTLMHTYMAHIPTISGIDIALWDLAGKILNRPVFELLGGPFREAIPMISHGYGFDMLDMKACRDWVDSAKGRPEGFKAFKVSLQPIIGVRPMGRFTATLETEQIGRIGRAFGNLREAAGDSIDFAAHCHNEFDAPSAVAIARALEPSRPLFIEDPLYVPYSDAWLMLRQGSRIRILTGEKLEMIAGFRPFLDHNVVDILQPDLAFAGGITGVRKIAEYAALTRIPVSLHNVGSLVLTCATAHFAASIQNFYRAESALGSPKRVVEELAVSNPPEIRNGLLPVPTGVGLGFELNQEVLKRRVLPEEPFWS